MCKALRDKHVNPVLSERPVDQECCVRELFGVATQLDRLVPDDLRSVGGGLRFEKRLKIRRRFDHRQLGKRQPLVDERIEAVGKF